MIDDFSERYGDLLSGSYDCVDRIVLKACACLCFALDSGEQQRSGFGYEFSVYQVAYSRN